MVVFLRERTIKLNVVIFISSSGGRGQRGRDNGEEEDAAKQRPSGPATLFDFLETKIKPGKG